MTGSKQPEELDLVKTLFDALAAKDFDQVKQVIRNNPSINLNCVDENELSPLQHACHFGDIDLAKFLLDNGADVNFANRKDGYTPLMFAAISSKAEVVKLLLERGVDTTVENCVHRTAAQMAAFVGQSKIVTIINSWVPYETTIEPFTRCRELEDKPRIPTVALGRLLHQFVVYPSLHPIRLLLFMKENPDMTKYASEFIYTLESLSSKALKQPNNEECQSLKYYYLSYLLGYCKKMGPDREELLIRKLIKRDDPKEVVTCTKHLDLFLMECMLKFPYVQLSIYNTMTLALANREAGALAILTQTLDGPKMVDHESCSICGEPTHKKCSGCKVSYYCCHKCQMADWFQHKKVCDRKHVQ